MRQTSCCNDDYGSLLEVMTATEEFIRELSSQIKDFDSRMEAFEAAVADSDVQFLLSWAAQTEPELLDRYSLWDMLGDRDAFKKRVMPKVGGLDGQLYLHHHEADESS